MEITQILLLAVCFMALIIAMAIGYFYALSVSAKSAAETQDAVQVDVPRGTVEMTFDKLKELNYRKRMTPSEASAYYEKKHSERMRKLAEDLEE